MLGLVMLAMTFATSCSSSAGSGAISWARGSSKRGAVGSRNKR